MKYTEFREKVKTYPVFQSKLLPHLNNNPAVLRRQLTDWIKKGYVLTLKRGLYTLNTDDRAVGLSRYFVANQIYSPSFIGLETALSYYGIIPEAVHVIMSISSKKTQQFHNPFGTFIYHHVKPNFYGDYCSQKDEFNNTFLIATKERALVDFLYFKTPEAIDVQLFETAFRFQNLDHINKTKLKTIAHRFNQKKLNQCVQLLIQYIEENYD